MTNEIGGPEWHFLELMQDILDVGVVKQDRTGVGTRSIFGAQLRFNLSDGFPLLTTKKLHLRSIIHELLWFLNGDTNVRYLNENGVHIWDQWQDEDGELGPVYGKQWRSWDSYAPSDQNVTWDGQSSIDQIAQVIDRLKTNPDCRRMVVSAWNVADLPQMRLAPCHCLFQFYVAEGKLSCHMYQRSADLFLGVPFNIASYALLTQMTAAVVGLELGDLVISFGDVHIYSNHIEQCTEQLAREPRQHARLAAGGTKAIVSRRGAME